MGRPSLCGWRFKISTKGCVVIIVIIFHSIIFLIQGKLMTYIDYNKMKWAQTVVIQFNTNPFK
jgi:hypothetical protein